MGCVEHQARDELERVELRADRARPPLECGTGRKRREALLENRGKRSRIVARELGVGAPQRARKDRARALARVRRNAGDEVGAALAAFTALAAFAALAALAPFASLIRERAEDLFHVLASLGDVLVGLLSNVGRRLSPAPRRKPRRAVRCFPDTST